MYDKMNVAERSSARGPFKHIYVLCRKAYCRKIPDARGICLIVLSLMNYMSTVLCLDYRGETRSHIKHFPIVILPTYDLGTARMGSNLNIIDICAEKHYCLKKDLKFYSLNNKRSAYVDTLFKITFKLLHSKLMVFAQGKSRIAKEAFNRKMSLLTRKLIIELRKKSVMC